MAEHKFYKFDPAHAERLMSGDREQILPTARILDLLDARPGQVAADVGCGPGYFTLPLARRVLPDGRVLACDIAPEMLAKLQEQLAAEAVTNVEAHLSAESSVPLAAASCDRVLLAHLLHELAEPLRFLAEVRRITKPGGRGLAVDWAPRESPFGPPLESRVAPDDAVAWLRAAGLAPEEPLDVGPYSYAIIFHVGAEHPA